MPRIQPLEITEASPAAQTAIQEHLRQGYRLTNEKRTLLHNAVAFEALEAQSYAVDKELQRLPPIHPETATNSHPQKHI